MILGWRVSGLELVVEHMAAGFFRAKKVWSEGFEMAIAFDAAASDLTHTLRCIHLMMAGVDTASR